MIFAKFFTRPQPVAQPRNNKGQFTADRARYRSTAQKLRVQMGLPISEALL